MPSLTADALAWASFWVSLVGTVATVAALVTAIVLGAHEIRALRREATEREQQRLEEVARARRAQAECVSGVMYLEQQQYGEGYFARADVVNASALPVYDVEVIARSDDLPPGKVIVQTISVVVGQQTEHVHLPPQLDRQRDRTPVQLTFRDAAGAWWHRGEQGQIHEIDEGDRYSARHPAEALRSAP